MLAVDLDQFIAVSLPGSTSMVITLAGHSARHHPSETILSLFRRFPRQTV